MRRTICIPAACTVAAIAAGGASAQRAQPAGAQVGAKATLLATVKVTAKEFKFTLSAKTAKRGVVVFKVTNIGALQHDFEISGRKTKLLSHGQSDAAQGDLPAQRQLSLQVHGARSRGARNEGILHDHVSVSTLGSSPSPERDVTLEGDGR